MARSTAGARRTAGLTEQDIAELSRQLADGKRPRVQLSGPHFPVGAAGTVVRIGSPEADGPDFVRVRVKVNGMTDELAFAPGELSLRRAAGRTAKASSSAASADSAPPPSPQSDVRRQSPAKARRSRSVPADTPTAPATMTAPATTIAPAGRPAAKAAAARTEPGKAAAVPAEPAKAAAVPAEPAKAGRRRKGGTPTVTFTISSTGASWTLTGSRGNKSLVRNVPLPPGAVSAVAELLDQSALIEAVSEINDAALAEARARAEQLRAELDKLEAVLATHRRP